MSKDDLIIHIWDNKNIIKYCKEVGRNNWEELRSELINQLYNMDIKKLTNAYNNNFLEYMCFTIASRIKNGHVSNTGIFYKHSSVSIQTDLEPIEKDNSEEEDDNIEELLNKTLDLIEEQHWYNKTLFKLYYIEGKKLREISEMFGINIKSIHYAITKVKKEIKKTIKRR